MWQKLQKTHDKENLHIVIQNVPKQFNLAFENDLKISNNENVVFCGMGGSAFPGDLFKEYLHNTQQDKNLNIVIHRNYSLPYQVDKNWTVIINSYSGNTEEALSALNTAQKRKIKNILVISHNGKLKEIAKKNKYQFIQVPDTEQPRMGYAFIVGSLLKVFHNSGLIKEDFETLQTDLKKIDKTLEKIRSQAQDTAKDLKNKIPIIYATPLWETVARVWKINFNENSKIQSFYNTIPEMNHNEMVGYTKLLAKYHFLIISDNKDHNQNKKRINVLAKLLAPTIKTTQFQTPTGSIFYKMSYCLLLGLWISYYLALINKIDPTPVKLVEQFKKKL